MSKYKREYAGEKQITENVGSATQARKFLWEIIKNPYIPYSLMQECSLSNGGQKLVVLGRVEDRVQELGGIVILNGEVIHYWDNYNPSRIAWQFSDCPRNSKFLNF